MNYKKYKLTIISMFILCSLVAQESYIQIKSEEGLLIFLNENLIGKTSSDLGGLIIENVKTGNHIIKAVKNGKVIKEESIEVGVGEILVVDVSSNNPNTNNYSGRNKFGVLIIQSIPMDIEITIPSINITKQKNVDKLEINSIPEGKYQVKYLWKGKELSNEIDIKENQIVKVFANMLKMETNLSIDIIEDKSTIEYIIVDRNRQFNNNLDYDSFTDNRDGRSYRTIKIGRQIWMAENLAYLPSVKPHETVSDFEAVYAVPLYYGNDVFEARRSAAYKSNGVVYNWVAAQNACPNGWHLPTIEEWDNLRKSLKLKFDEIDKETQKEMRSLGMNINEISDNMFDGRVGGSGKLKSHEGWYGNEKGTNESGFSAIPSIPMRVDGKHTMSNGWAEWLAGSECDSENASHVSLYFNDNSIYFACLLKRQTSSIRCIKDK